jgi:superfamily II DNA/RNA helicase
LILSYTVVLIFFCRVLDIGAKDVAAVKPLLKDLPDIIVGTPGRLAQHLK